MKIAKDLEDKSKDDEDKIHEMNVAIENLTMNFSLRNRGVD